jgi:hypothetical protein
MMTKHLRWLVPLLALVEIACEQGTTAPSKQLQAVKPDPATAVAARHTDLRAGLSFAALDGLRIEAEHFPRDTAAGVIKDILTVSGPQGTLLSIDVWHDPERLPLASWFDKHLAFVRDGNAAIGWAPMTRHQALGMNIERLRSPQAYGQRIALVAVSGRVVRVTCYDSESPAAVAAFTRVVDSLEVRP